MVKSIVSGACGTILGNLYTAKASGKRKAMVDFRIAELRLRSFRAVPLELRISFSNADGERPSSCLILGDNGTGKSSIVDGIEFALQGRVHPFFGVSTRTNIGRLPNLAFKASGKCMAEVRLSDKSLVMREVKWDPSRGHWASSSPDAIPGFQGACFALRREDILSFLRASADRRTQMFAAFLRSVASLEGHSADDEELIESAKIKAEELRVKQFAIAKQLSMVLKVDAETLQPLNPKSPLDSIFVERGLIRNALQRRRRSLRLKPEEEELFDLRNKLTAGAKEHQAAVAAVRDAIKRAQYKPVARLVAKISGTVSRDFKRLSPSSSFISDIVISLGDNQDEIILEARLGDGSIVPVEHYLSEASLDLLALLLFLGLLREAASRGQAKILILDDVLQSVDGTIRLQVARYLLDEFGDWQLILTFHDRFWREQFRTLCAQKGHRVTVRDITKWEFSQGPILVQVGADISMATRSVMSSDSPSLIASQAGLLLETSCDWLSKSLGTSVTRRPDDKYTLGDTWPGILKVLRRFDTSTLAENVDLYFPLRNLIGAHYNEWAQSVTLTESQQFAQVVLDLWDKIWCPKCRSTLTRTGAHLACRCGFVLIGKSRTD
ncbi:AAA family ATPase [Nonomuraea sp. ZG12]|uniref:AAA family ATPase n=1 Tax=Nonomuraea sp. ZG12 TaxID=3452207 RepID=UPI003F8B2355